ncbi:cytochrome P450 [Streptomyces sp. NBC_01426]|uniref:cytochrome P450 n=1 Tax=Streptomyces sp. NBC_01426 TaxID=2975866 RepID=UPI003FCEC436
MTTGDGDGALRLTAPRYVIRSSSALAAGVETTASLLAWNPARPGRPPGRGVAGAGRVGPGSSPDGLPLSSPSIERVSGTRQVLVRGAAGRGHRPDAQPVPLLEGDRARRFHRSRGRRCDHLPYALHRDPGVVPAPELLDPDRWLLERVTPAQRQAFMAFGGGRRRLGEHYGMTETVLCPRRGSAAAGNYARPTPPRCGPCPV